MVHKEVITMVANGLGEYDMAFVEKGYEQAVEFEG